MGDEYDAKPHLLLEIRIGIVLPRDQKRGDLQPGSGLVADVAQGLQHGLQVAAADTPVEALGEGLEVDVGGVHAPVELGPRLPVHVASRDRDGFDAPLPARLCHVDRVFMKDDRVVVREGDAATAQPSGSVRDQLGRRLRLRPRLDDLEGVDAVEVNSRLPPEPERALLLDDGIVRAVDGVTFEMKRGETLCIVGESGCGKSTVIFSILNLMAENAVITGGEVNFEGRNILKMSPTQLRDLRGDPENSDPGVDTISFTTVADSNGF